MTANRIDDDLPMSELFVKYLDDVREGRVGGTAPTGDIESERRAYKEMILQIENEEDREIKKFMWDTLEYYCQDRAMLLSYIQDNCWNRWVNEQRNLQKTVQPLEIFIDIESIMAGCCDTTGYTGPNDTTKYNLTIPGAWDGETKTRHLRKDVSRIGLLRSYFKFGVHKFLVGRAIKEIIEYFETRYDLDFNELERIYQTRDEQEVKSSG